MMKFSVSNFCIEIEAHTDTRKRHLTCITICLRIIKGTAFLTISEFRRFGLATRRDATRFCKREHFYPRMFLPSAVATPSIRR